MRHRPEPAAARYRFGARVLDLAQRELRLDGIPQPLPARVFECLQTLIEHRDRAVGRDELVRAVFGRPDVSDAQLAQVVLRARRAIGDDGQEQRAIRTVPRFGFRWAMDIEEVGEEVAPVEAAVVEPEIETPTPPPVAANDDDAPKPIRVVATRAPRRRRWPFALAAVIALCAIASVFAWPQWRAMHAVASTAQSRGAIVVLPMQVEGDDSAAWARLGMMDFVVDRLRRANQPVWSSEATLALLRTQGDTPDAQRVRRDSPAAWIVESRARNVRQRWDVALTALDAKGRTITGRANAADLVGATRQATDRLLAAIGGTSPRVAHDAPDFEERLQRAQSALLANDPDTARRLLHDAPLAQRQTPQLQYRLAQVDFADGRHADGLAKTTHLLRLPAVQGDATLRAQLESLQGRLLMRLDRYADAERSFDRAIAAFVPTPNASELGRALIGRGTARMAQGRFDEALSDLGSARVQLVRAGDRLSVAKVDGNLGVLEMQRDRPREAAQAFEKAERDFKALDATVELSGVRNMLVAMHLMLLQPEQAVAVSDRAWAVRERLRDPAHVADLVLARAETLITLGRLQEADALLRLPQSRASSPGDFHRHEYLEMELARQRGDAAAVARIGTQVLRDWPAQRNGRLRAWVAWRAHEAALDAELPTPPNASALDADALTKQLGIAVRHRREGDFNAADTAYKSAIAIAEASGVPGMIANAVIARAHFLLAQDRVDEATALVGRVAPWADRDFELALLQVALYTHLRQAGQQQAALALARRLAGERPVITRL
ncbi:Transcriptional regulator [Lysobacter dokdonensis DS-58]|uniref:Transcriptional regulator n=1 Tax=Lysobacter dokdonensis DS-58 TaxID=1300345 RepID=A0A0A2WY63_9GAMM|nr:winged helix-turn-helix domain-containing protein [Lysobacter dokdonensis]KGQ17969.1 Transcriptional regulator [Lysobacter dokdonensis DS-58]